MRILLVSQMTPYLPSHDGVRTLAAHLVQHLARRHTVAVIAGAGRGETPEQRRWAASRCLWVETLSGGPGIQPGKGAPAEGLRDAVARAVYRFMPHVLHLEGGVLAPLARVGGVPTVLGAHDSGALRARELRRFCRAPWSWLAARLAERRAAAWEARWFAAADARIVLSEEDGAALGRLGTDAEVIPFGIDLHHHEFRRAGQSGRIVFTGNLSWPPNVDAARRFARVILPRVRARHPRAEFVVAGADPAPGVRALAALPGVLVTAAVPDLRPSIWGAAIAVSPLRAGFGTKNRVLEAMALGTPVVASPRSLSGLAEVVAGQHVLAAASDDAMAEAVLTLLGDPALADRLAHEARALVEAAYGWPAIIRRYEALLGRVAGTVPAERAA